MTARRLPVRRIQGPQRGPNLRGRLRLMAVLLGLCGVALVAKAAEMQLLRSEFYQAKGDARFVREIAIPTSRGMITDRNGEPLAISTPVESIWASPRELLKHPARLADLAMALEQPLEELKARVEARAERDFVYLRRRMTPDQAEPVMALKIPGVYSTREYQRFYPLGDVAAHVLGYTNIDDQGQEGLELAFNDWLTGKPGAKRVIKDRLGRVVENIELVRAAEQGRTLELSLDRRLQHLVHRELQHALLENAATSGSAVVLDVATGEILAMVNLPSYNPNLLESVPAARRNRAVTDVFEPGSVIKAFTVAAALETGRVMPDTVIETSPGYMPLANHVVRDIRNFGTLTVTGLLTKSSNIAATKLALDMPNEHLHDVLHRFGFGELSGSGFPGEQAGVLTAPQGWGVVEKATISYGYGLSTTVLQLAQAYAALGNGGVWMPATFVHGGAGEGRAAIDPQLAQTMLGMLETVTGPQGSAQRAGVPGYRVAGKTGTSRRSIAGGYEKRYISVFAGLVPASKPRYAMALMINDPDPKQYYGGLVAAPVFGRVMADALRLLDVPPDNVEQLLAAAPAVPAEAADALTLEAESVAEALDAAAGPEMQAADGATR
ncbi:MAG: penicillin-binding protein 2 [Xanthomonadales bacterium]|nr:penicillin-binding protein 2 [Xanthomonadales bacterium]